MDPPDNLLCPKIDINKRQKQERYEDKCWTEQYRGDSRKWVLKDVSVQDTVPVSTMKTSYIPPHVRSLMTDFKTSTGTYITPCEFNKKDNKLINSCNYLIYCNVLKKPSQ